MRILLPIITSTLLAACTSKESQTSANQVEERYAPIYNETVPSNADNPEDYFNNIEQSVIKGCQTGAKTMVVTNANNQQKIIIECDSFLESLK